MLRCAFQASTLASPPRQFVFRFLVFRGRSSITNANFPDAILLNLKPFRAFAFTKFVAIETAGKCFIHSFPGCRRIYTNYIPRPNGHVRVSRLARSLQ
jgi:hypothetical protein